MDKKNLFEKVWEAHSVGLLANGQTQLFVGRHLIHEVTSPQAFGMLREKDLPVRYPERTFATVTTLFLQTKCKNHTLTACRR